MTIPYLVGGETISASYMNALFAGLDSKLTKLLAGSDVVTEADANGKLTKVTAAAKSFFLAQDAAMPQKFCGKAFFFTTGAVVYARRVPGWVDTGGGITRPYNHSQFANAVAAIDLAKVTWDETNKVALVPAFPASLYAGLPNTIDLFAQKPLGTGFLDWSLQAHTILHQGVSDTAPVPYFIQETSVNSSVAPEKHYRFCVAEIIIEGPALVTLPTTFDKYCCFRIHNFNSTPATLKFSTTPADPTKVVTVQLNPFSCVTVRRDAAADPGANYRAGFNYFFKFQGGDPRFYWFAPKVFTSGGAAQIGDSTVVTNSMQANNLTNPAILLDWVDYFRRDLGPGLSAYATGQSSALADKGFYAGWQQDAGVQADVWKFYKTQFGDPSDPTTLLGDLIHHKGDIMIIRSSKTLTDPITSQPVVVIDKVTFKGYATIINDFAAKQLAVAENGSGDLMISNTDAANNVYLVPHGTNLFKKGETHPTIVSLVGKSFTIENAIFENPDPSSLSSTAPQLIFQPVTSQGSTSKTWNTWDTATLSYDTPASATGNPQTTLNWATNRSTATVLYGIHKVKVSDVLKLDFWGDPKVPRQNSNYVTITNQKLTLTPEGLVITYTETDSGARAPGDNDWINLKRGVPTVKSIAFRGHGFGYFSAANGSRDTGWLTGRTGRYQFDNAYQYESVGPSGQDFQVSGSPSQATVSVLGRLRLAGGISAAGRFFGTSVGDSLLKFIQNAGLDARTFGALFGQSNEVGINNGSAPVVTGTVSPVAMVLLPEMYNGMARAVNAINRASPLNWRCLRWNVFGKSVGLDTASTFGLFFNGSWDPNTNTTSGAVFQDTGSLKSGVGVPGFAYQCSNSGSTPLDGNSGWVPGDVATFTIAGQWVKSHPSVLSNSQIWGNYAGIMPMSCFSTFDAGSQYEALCGVIGIAVRTASDFPPAATGQAFTDLQNAIVGRGVLIDMVRCVSSTATVDLSSAPPAATSATLTGEIISDLLSAKKLIAGQVTGTQCLGTWTDSLLQLGTSYLVNAGYGDIGKYWVVPDDASSLLGAIKRGDLVMINGFSGDPSTTLYGTVSLSPMATLLNKQKGVTLAGVDLNIYSTAGGGIRWITITDVQSAVEALGFQFSYTEQLIPMALYHYDEPYVGNVIFSQSRGPVLASGTSNAVLGSTYIPSSFSIVAGSDPKLGNWIKFVVSGDGGALWKSRNFEEVFGVNPIADLNPNAGHSPIMVLTNGKMVFDPSLHVGAGIGPVFQLGGGQHVGASGDDVSTTPDVSSTYFAGYKVTVYDPTGPADIINQTPTISDRGFEVCAPYLEGVHDRQFYTQAFLVQNSAGFQAFPTQVVLLPNEAWTRPASWWTQSLFNANWYQDLIGNGPWQYLAPTGSTTRITLSNGLTVVAPPGTNAFYNLLTNVGPPIIEM